MAHLLHVDSSADPERSRSRAIGRTFAESWLAAAPGNTVTYRDLHADPLPHLPDAALHWPPRLRPEGATPPPDAEALQTELIAELTAADVVLIDAPMYNYSLPSALKAWIDYIHVPGVTAAFDGPTQPMAGRTAVVVTSRGASYDPETLTADWDHAVPVLTLIFEQSLGMTVEVITTSLTLADSAAARFAPPLAAQLPRATEELATAHRIAAEEGARLGAEVRSA